MSLFFRRLHSLVTPLWRSGLLKLGPFEFARVLVAWWRCRGSFAFLASVAALRSPERLALRDDDGDLSFRQLEELSLRLACRLRREFNIGSGSRVALMAPNHRSFVIALLAVTRLGADILPLSPDMPASVLDALMLRESIDVLVYAPELGSRLKSLDSSVARTTCFSDRPASSMSLGSAGQAGELIVLTSGTSGVAKGIRRRPSLGTVLFFVAGLMEKVPITMHRPVIFAIPLFHGYGLMALAFSLALGSSIHLRRRYEILPLLATLERGAVPYLVTVPTLLSRWLKSEGGASLPCFEAVITGSAPLGAELCKKLSKKVGNVLFNFYGSTETGVISVATPNDLAVAPGCVGRPLPGNTVSLTSPHGESVCRGQIGQVLVRGPFVLPSREGGWRETGDLGRFDPQGYLFIQGRVDDMVVSGGENVYPHEVEEVLNEHPLVEDSVVLAVTDEELGQRLVAFFTIHEGVLLEGTELRDWLRKRLEYCKVPKEVYRLEELPRNALGKVSRHTLLKIVDSGPTE